MNENYADETNGKEREKMSNNEIKAFMAQTLKSFVNVFLEDGLFMQM